MKPKSVEIYPVYICQCGNRHCESLEYINKIGRILCACGDVLELEGIETFKIAPVFRNSRPTKKNNNNQQVDIIVKSLDDSQPVKPPPVNEEESPPMFESKQEYDKALDLLESLGWKTKEAKKRVKEAASSFCSHNKGGIGDSNFEKFAKDLIFS